jgi:DNA adenine methylase
LDYREPFFGAGGIGLRVIESLPPGACVWINDADPGIANYWRCIVEHPAALSARIQSCVPTIECYRTCLAQAQDPHLDIVESAFVTVFLHQCSYSGLGKKAGSPIGGWHQGETKPTYDVSCRWRPAKLVADIAHWHRVPAHTFFYCDPPYVKRGAELYSQAMGQEDHARLAARLLDLPCPWVLSYDDDPLVRRLYNACVIQELAVRYTVAYGTAEQNALTHELLIVPPPSRPRWSLRVTGRTGYRYRALAHAAGLPASTIRNRIRRGWTMEKALQQPRRCARGAPEA